MTSLQNLIGKLRKFLTIGFFTNKEKAVRGYRNCLPNLRRSCETVWHFYTGVIEEIFLAEDDHVTVSCFSENCVYDGYGRNFFWKNYVMQDFKCQFI